MTKGIILAFSLALSGCVMCPSHYRATAVVVGEANSSAESPPLVTVVAEALKPLGYTGPETPQHDAVTNDMVYFEPPRRPSKKLRSHPIVSLDTKAKAIYVFDIDSSLLTDFARSVQRDIADRIRETYGLTLTFVTPRHPEAECLGP